MPDHPWDRVNPNIPTDQSYVVTIPKNPTAMNTTGCLPMGMIGLTKTGVALYNPLAIGNINAVEGEG